MKSEHLYQVGSENKIVTIDPNENNLLVTVEDHDYQVTSPQQKEGKLYFSVDGQSICATVAQVDNRWYVNIDGQQWVLSRPSSSRSRRGTTAGGDDASSGLLTASMPAQVVEILVEIGDQVERGQTLVLLEAMKMEMRISAPFAGAVQKIYCTQNETVERDQPLVELGQAPSTEE
ncbi:MAG: acetyl-CoA carboxylase biotin carboxyl carrier protein subunit [Chloroflexota bacterium]